MTKNSLENEIKQDNRKKKKFFNANNSLADFIVPFIMEPNPFGKICDLYLKYLVFEYNYPNQIINSNIFSLIDHSLELYDFAEKMRSLYSRMLQVAFEEKELDMEEGKKLESDITGAMPKIMWRGRSKTGGKTLDDPDSKPNAFANIPYVGNAIIGDKSFKKNDILFFKTNNNQSCEITDKGIVIRKLDIELMEYFQGIITLELVEAFDSSKNKEPFGYTYIGKCPECGRFFVKPSKNKILCSNTCSSNKRSREFRGKKNK